MTMPYRFSVMVTENILYHLTRNIHKKDLCNLCASVLGYPEIWILSRTLSALITGSKCYWSSSTTLRVLDLRRDACNCSFVSACPRDYILYQDNNTLNMDDCWSPVLSSAHYWILLSIWGVRRGGDHTHHTVTVWTKNGSGFQLQSQLKPTWLSASERRVPLLCCLRMLPVCVTL